MQHDVRLASDVLRCSCNSGTLFRHGARLSFERLKTGYPLVPAISIFPIEAFSLVGQ